MLKPNYKEICRRIKELSFQIAGKSHLYLEACELCSMPFIQSTGVSQRYKRCESCRERIKKYKEWQKKVEPARQRARELKRKQKGRDADGSNKNKV